MTVGRNDLCPCGSGKKYKRCCLVKENIIQLDEHRREQFYQNKHTLVDKVREFIVEQVSFNEYHQLKSQFRNRLNNDMDEDSEDHYFNFWLHFFHEFSNGLRGIEWFYNENEHRLHRDEKTMAKTWTTLTPKLIQAVNKTEEAVIFRDLFTDEEYPVSNHEENLPHFYPWLSTFAPIESFEEYYYFNGVRSYVTPEAMQHAQNKVDELLQETNKSYDEIAIKYYPEILSALLSEVHVEQLEENETRLVEYIVDYEVKNEVPVIELLQSLPELTVEQWTETEKVFGWIGNWRRYQDNKLHKEVRLADVYARITVANGKLLFSCFDEARRDQMKENFAQLENDLVLEREEAFPVQTFSVQIQNTVVSLEQDTPRFYALYAQNAIINELDHPIPIFDHLSLRQMKEANRLEEVDVWLKQTEYNLYRLVLEQFGEVKITADFNTARRKLGLSLSPFVTGGDDRQTGYELIEEETEEPSTLTEDDIPYLEQLGFTPETIDNYYVEDIMKFYRKRTEGRSETTVRKYTNSLSTLRELFERKPVSSWTACDVTYWDQLLREQYFELIEDPSKTERKDFLSTVRMLLTWLDERTDSPQFADEVELIREIEREDDKVLAKN